LDQRFLLGLIIARILKTTIIVYSIQIDDLDPDRYEGLRFVKGYNLMQETFQEEKRNGTTH